MALDPKRLVRIGTIAKAHGLRGEVIVRPDDPESTTLLTQKEAWLKAKGAEAEPMEIETARTAHEAVLMRFKGCLDRTQAEKLAGREVLLPRERLPETEEGEFYAEDLVGLAVQSPDGTELGKVAEVVETRPGVPAVLEIEGPKSFQVPLVDTFVKRIDIVAGVIVVEAPEEE